MSNLEVLEDNTDEVRRLIPKALARGLEKVGLTAEGYAKKLCPVDTGRLRNSITHQLKGLSVYIGTAVEYGRFVEYGTKRQKAQPYLRPTATDHADRYHKIIEDELKNV